MTKERIDNIITRADKDGVFNDHMGDAIVRKWNHDNRIKKARNALERDTIPMELVMYAIDENYYTIP